MFMPKLLEQKINIIKSCFFNFLNEKKFIFFKNFNFNPSSIK